MNRAERRRQEKLGKVPPPTSDLKALLNEAIAHHQAGRLSQAEQLYREILRVNPDHAETLHLLGLLAYRVGNLETAVALISQAMEQDSQKAPYPFNLGVVLHKQGKLDDAVAAYKKALALNPYYVEAQSNLGNVFMERGRLDDAVACYERAVSIRPNYVEGYNNLGAALKEQGKLDEAVAAYQRALSFKPNHVEAHSNLGMALMEQGKLDEAVGAFDRALSLKPDYQHAHYNLAFALIRQQRFDRALRCLRTSAELKHNHGRPVPDQFIYRSRLKHDAEQIQYLLDRRLLSLHYAAYLTALKQLRRRAGEQSDGSHRLALTAQELEAIAPSFNRIISFADSPALPQGALNPALDVPEIEARYNATRPEVMYVDDLLNQDALRSLRAFCLESTIWKRDYDNGYIGAFFGDGLSCPLLLQIAEELRLRFPRIFKDYLLTQAWAFKYDSELKGLNIHADAAAVNVNFWITPDEANLDPSRGGLVVWDKEAPKDWNFKEYNSSKNEPKVREFLRSSGAKAISIPYRQNRAVVFNSDLFHETDQFRFKDEYESRRLNITLLYGRRCGLGSS